VDVVWVILIVGVCGLMWFAASLIEPHWSTRDGRRFVCNAQELSGGRPLGRNRETQITVLGDGSLQVTRKRTMRRHHSLWRLVGKTPTPPQRVEIYLAQQLADGQVMADMLAIRLPRKSRCVAVLDQVLADQELTPTQTPGTSVSPDQPDRG